MATSPAPHAHLVRVREKSTGRVFDAYPVDAREIVSHPDGRHEYAPDAPLGLPDAPEVEVAPLSLRERLDEKSHKELVTLAKKAGVNANQKKDALIEALIPHIEANAISIEAVPSVAFPPAEFPNARQPE